MLLMEIGQINVSSWIRLWYGSIYDRDFVGSDGERKRHLKPTHRCVDYVKLRINILSFIYLDFIIR